MVNLGFVLRYDKAKPATAATWELETPTSFDFCSSIFAYQCISLFQDGCTAASPMCGTHQNAISSDPEKDD